MTGNVYEKHLLANSMLNYEHDTFLWLRRKNILLLDGVRVESSRDVKLCDHSILKD